MPSGHTTAAFAFAASVTDETAHLWPKQTWWVATLTYGSAAAVGVARIYSNAHWTSDVVAGAFVGTLSGLVVNRWHRAHPGSKLDKWLLPKTVSPTKGGVAMTWSAAF
jgi:membrane-associated phospholipid phosphatase